jgi:hypothetical protein
MPDNEDVQTAQTQTGIVNVSGVEMSETVYQARMGEVRGDYASALDDISTKFTDLEATIGDIEAGINMELAQNRDLSQQVYQRMTGEMNTQITNIRNAQNMQVTQSASQLDAMLASGQFGGNVYRSQQVYAMNMSNIIGAAMQNVATVSLQYTQATESLQAEYSAQQLTGYIQGANLIVGAMTDLAKTYAMVRSDLTLGKNKQLNDVMNIKAEYDISNATLQQQEYLTTMQVSAQKLMAQWQIDASYRETSMKIDLSDRQRVSAERIAANNNSVQRDLAALNDRLQRDLQKYDISFRKDMQARELKYNRWRDNRSFNLQRHLGEQQTTFAYAQLDAKKTSIAEQEFMTSLSQGAAAQSDSMTKLMSKMETYLD